MKSKIFYIVLIVSFFTACSSEKEKLKNEEVKSIEELVSENLNVKFDNVYSWINLMPGPKAKPRFNITGEIELYESSDYDFSQMSLSQINIYQNGKSIYSVKPQIREDKTLSTDKMSFRIFSTIKGLLLTNVLNTEETISAQFIFEDGSKSYSYYIEDIKIDKAY